MAGIFWVLHVGNFAGVSFGGLLARITNNLPKRVRTGGIPHAIDIFVFSCIKEKFLIVLGNLSEPK